MLGFMLVARIVVSCARMRMGDMQTADAATVRPHGSETITQTTEPLPPFLAEPSKIGQEISVTGKWIPTKQGGRFRKSAESNEMLTEWEDIHTGAKRDAGVLSTEINHAVGEDAVLVHHVFKDPDALIHYFSTTATQHMGALTKVAKPQLHIVRGASVPAPVREAVLAKNVPAAFGELLFGYVKEDYRRPDQDRRRSWSPPSGRASRVFPPASTTSSTGGSESVPTHTRWRRVCSGSRRTRSSARTP